MPRHEVVAEMDEQQRVEIVKAVAEAMRACEAAERALDAERVIAHFCRRRRSLRVTGGACDARLSAARLAGAVTTLLERLDEREVQDRRAGR